MSLYYNNFKYLDENSIDKGLIVASFEPDDGFVDSFLSMDPIQEDYYDGTKKFDYGARYNDTAKVNITVIKSNGADFSLADVRSLSKWLTGSRINSWLDVGPSQDDIRYSFLGRVTNLQPRKLDGRTTGFLIEFTSISPWAYSAEEELNRSIEQKLYIDEQGVLISNELSIDESGVLCNGSVPGQGACFLIDNGGAIYVENKIIARINNETDDVYSYIYLDIEFTNDSCDHITIYNETLNETTRIDNLQSSDVIYITGKQFITAYSRDQITGNLVNQNRIFGDSFNFVWPRLAPGVNNFIIEGNGNGTVKFAYRYPMKVGDCAMDISVYGGNTSCGEMVSYETVKWENIVGAPTSISGYGIADAYTKYETDRKIEELSEQDIIVTISLLATEWVAVNDMYAQVVVIEQANENSRVYLYPSVEQIATLQDASITLVSENNNGTVTIYAIGGCPTIDYEIQAALSESDASSSGSTYINEEELNNMLFDLFG